ncbi:MAG: hypothetical protein GX228_03425 [Firmicutes bacterium]|jgi:hypothetical protein|nr:hypothetical protein [Bacillota bacterium]NLL87972.1 hypothetical protein [Bacillota bacterium]HKM17971.1 hypothetical protein [Limnochordia bacterium]
MSSLTKDEIARLEKQIAALRKENAMLRKELGKQQAYIQVLEDVSLTLPERSVLLGKKLPED